MRRALLSVSDKTGLVGARAGAWRLAGFELVSTGGTARALAAAGLRGDAGQRRHPVPRDAGRPREDPAPRDPRRHPRAPVAARTTSRHSTRLGIAAIDLVVGQPLSVRPAAAADPPRRSIALIEEIDIGGPSLVRAAAKNFRDVLVVVSPADYATVIGRARSGRRPDRCSSGSPWRGRRSPTPRRTTRPSPRRLEPRHGRAGRFRAIHCRRLAISSRIASASSWRSSATFATARTRTSGPPGTGLGPADAAAARDPGQGAVVHQPDRSRRRAADRREFERAGRRRHQAHESLRGRDRRVARRCIRRARDADALSAFGGIVGLNRPIDEATARAIAGTFIEAVIAPAIGGARAAESWRPRRTCGS